MSSGPHGPIFYILVTDPGFFVDVGAKLQKLYMKM